MAKRISIINFKGGVGKTTLAFHLGTGLAKFHNCRVLLIDMDHQSSLSIVCLGSQSWKEAIKNEQIINQVFRPFVRQIQIPPGKEIITEDPMGKKDGIYNNYNSVDIVPASLNLDDLEIELTASHSGNAIKSEWDKRTLVCQWIEDSGIDAYYDYIIFDCPPATKIVSQNAIAASHGYIIPVIPEAVMERGAPHLHGMIGTGIDAWLNKLSPHNEICKMHVPSTALVGLVITRIQKAGNAHSGYTNDHTQHLRSLERYWDKRLVLPYIEQGVGLSEALAEGVPVYDRAYTQNVGSRGLHIQYQNLTGELKRRIDAI